MRTVWILENWNVDIGIIYADAIIKKFSVFAFFLLKDLWYHFPLGKLARMLRRHAATFRFFSERTFLCWAFFSTLGAAVQMGSIVVAWSFGVPHSNRMFRLTTGPNKFFGVHSPKRMLRRQSTHVKFPTQGWSWNRQWVWRLRWKEYVIFIMLSRVCL